MRFYELVKESRGIFGRKLGDPFIHTDGTTADFVQVMVFPNPSQGKFEDAAQRDSVIAELETQLKTKIQWANQAKNNLSFAIAELKTSDGDIILWGRYLNTSTGILAGKWKNNEIPQGWKLNTATAQKLNVGYDPQTLVGENILFPNIDAALTHILARAKNVENGDILVEALQNLRAGQLPVFKGMAQQMPAIRDYLGEIITPIALAAGLIGDDAEVARTDLLQQPWAACRVRWPQSKNHNLVDSIFVNSKGFELAISSKGGSGAKASVKNISDAIERARVNSPELVATYKNTVRYVTILNDNSAQTGPLLLAVEFGIINQKTATDCLTMIKQGTKELPPQYAKLTQNYMADTTNQNYMAGLHLLASIAKLVAAKLNSLPDMSAGLQAFMNQASMVQIHLGMRTKGDDAIITGFKSVYPPRFAGTMVIDASKTYYATSKPDKMSFGFK